MWCDHACPPRRRRERRLSARGMNRARRCTRRRHSSPLARPRACQPPAPSPCPRQGATPAYPGSQGCCCSLAPLAAIALGATTRANATASPPRVTHLIAGRSQASPAGGAAHAKGHAAVAGGMTVPGAVPPAAAGHRGLLPEDAFIKPRCPLAARRDVLPGHNIDTPTSWSRSLPTRPGRLDLSRRFQRCFFTTSLVLLPAAPLLGLLAWRWNHGSSRWAHACTSRELASAPPTTPAARYWATDLTYGNQQAANAPTGASGTTPSTELPKSISPQASVELVPDGA